MLGDEEAGSVHAFRRLVRGREMREEGSNCSTCKKGHVFSSVSSPSERGCIQLYCSSVANQHSEKPGQVLRENQWSATFSKKKLEKTKIKFWTLPGRLKSTKIVPHPCQAEQTSSQGGRPVVSRETCQSARLSAEHQGAACNPTNTHKYRTPQIYSSHNGQYSDANPLSQVETFPVQFHLGGGITRF